MYNTKENVETKNVEQKLGNVRRLSKLAIRTVRVALMSLGMTFSFTLEVQITKNCCKNTKKIYRLGLHWEVYSANKRSY